MTRSLGVAVALLDLHQPGIMLVQKIFIETYLQKIRFGCGAEIFGAYQRQKKSGIEICHLEFC